MAKYVLKEQTARKLKELISGTMIAGRRPSVSGAMVDDAGYAHPYAVQWAASADDGAGAWIIWLPGDELLRVDNEAVDVAADLEDVGGDYPDGWYLLAGIESGDVYMNVTRDEDDDISVEFSSSEGEAGEGETVWPILIANVARNSTTLAVTVKNFVTSTVIISEGGSVAVDGVSIDKLNQKLELAHFVDGEKDSTKGLAGRLTVDTETGEVSSDDQSIMLVCRNTNGEIIYVPLSGSGSDPAAPNGTGEGPCDHPTDTSTSGGIDPTDGLDGPDGSIGSSGGVGGVSPEDVSTHPGDSNCNDECCN